MSKILKAKYTAENTPLKLGEVELPCYVLEDGTRVFSGRGMQRAIGASATSGTWLKKYVNSSPITPFLETGIIERFNNPIKFERPTAGGSQSMTYGYEVTILIDICEAVIKANQDRQNVPENIVKSAKTILIAVAKVGIIALVDEATGYQYDRERKELQTILKAYISEELLPWQKKFPDIFYKELFRLNGWNFTLNGIKKRPGVVGRWTNSLIYEQLPKGVLEELKSKTPKTKGGNYKARFFQSLTTDVGHPNLSAQINQILAIFTVSDNMKQMWSNFEKLNMRKSGQLELPFPFNDDGHTVEPKEKIKLSDLNQSLTKALNHNPRKQKEE